MAPLTVLELFAGAGGGILASQLLGHRTVAAVEIDDYCRRVLMQRQIDGVLDPFPIWDDVRTFNALQCPGYRQLRGRVDLIAAGFPCQDVSTAGKGAGLDGSRSSLWTQAIRVAVYLRAEFIFMENVPALTTRGLERILRALAACGYDAEWDVLGARHVGAPHKRDRIWILAYADGCSKHVRAVNGQMAMPRAAVANAYSVRGATGPARSAAREARAQPASGDWWHREPGMDRVVDGLAHRVDRCRALGNGQVPSCAAMAFRILYDRLMA